MSNRNRKKTKTGKFWSGSRKFFTVLLLFYLTFMGITAIFDKAKNRTVAYTRSDVEISGNQLISNDEILDLCGFDRKGNRAVQVDVNKIADKIMQLQFIRGVSITRRLPKKLNITVEEREPLAFIHGRGLNLIDREGFLIPIPNLKHSWDLPLISGIRQDLGSLGQKTKARDAFEALEFLDYIHRNHPLVYGMISEISMKSADFFNVYIIRGGANIRVNRSGYKRELHILKSYLVNYLDWKNLDEIDYIDLRFHDQLILRYKV